MDNIIDNCLEKLKNAFKVYKLKVDTTNLENPVKQFCKEDILTIQDVIVNEISLFNKNFNSTYYELRKNRDRFNYISKAKDIRRYFYSLITIINLYKKHQAEGDLSDFIEKSLLDDYKELLSKNIELSANDSSQTKLEEMFLDIFGDNSEFISTSDDPKDYVYSKNGKIYSNFNHKFWIEETNTFKEYEELTELSKKPQSNRIFILSNILEKHFNKGEY